MSTSTLVHTGKRIFKEVGEDDLSGFAAELAYRFFLALFPFFIFLTAMGGFASQGLRVDNPVDKVMDLMDESLPSDASSVLRGQIEDVTENKDVGLISIGAIGALWAASSGVGTIIKGMNRVHEVKETRPLPVRYALAVGLTLLGGVLILGVFLLTVVGQLYGLRLAEEVGLRGAAATAITLLRYPVAIAILMIAVAFLYWVAPNIKLPFKWISPGAVVFALGWVVASALFGLYVANFGSYNATYGALGGVVVLLIWFYLTGFILLLGAEINSVIAQEAARRELGTSEVPSPAQTEAALSDDTPTPAGVPASRYTDERQPERANGHQPAERGAEQKGAAPAGRPVVAASGNYAAAKSNGSHGEADRTRNESERPGVTQLALVGLITSVTLWRVVSGAVSKRNEKG